MADIKIAIGPVETVVTVDDSAAGRILAAFAVHYQQPDPVAVVQRIADDVISGLAAQAERIERDAATAAALEKIPPILDRGDKGGEMAAEIVRG